MRSPAASPGHLPVVGAADRARVLGQRSLGVPRCRLLPTGAAPLELRVIDGHVDPAVRRVDHDLVPLAHEGDRPADERLRSDMPNAVAFRRTAETAIRHEGDVLAQTRTRDGRGHREHLRHPRGAFRTLVPDHDDVARPDPTARHGLERLRLGVERASATPELERGGAGDLHHTAVGCEGAAEDRGAPFRVDRVGGQMHDRAVGRGRRRRGQVLRHRLAGDRQARAVEHAEVEELLHHDGDPADPVQVAHHESARRAYVHQVGHAPADRVEVVELQFDVRLPRDREQVQDRVRRTRERHRDRDRVLERLAGHDLSRPEIELQEMRDGDPALACRDLAPVVHRGGARRAGERHAERLSDGGHRVRRVHPGARPRGRARRAFELEELGVGHLTLRVRADRLEHVLDRDVAAPVGAGEDRSAVEIDRRQIQPGHRHQHARLGLVASRDPDERIHPLRVHHQLDRVGDEIARHQRRLHPLVTHRDPVGDRDRRELERDATGLADAFLRERRELVEVVVAGRHLVPRGGHRDLCLVEVVVAETHRAQVRTGRRSCSSLGDLPAAGSIDRHRILPGEMRAGTLPTRFAGSFRAPVASEPMNTLPPNEGRGWWLREALARPEFAGEPCPPLDTDTKADVVILGGGYTGMWSAWFLKELDPGLDIVLLEQDICGGGPSGRNGGFVNSFWDELDFLAERHGDASALRICRAGQESVDDIGRFCTDHEIDAWFAADGSLSVASSTAQIGAWADLVMTVDRMGLSAIITVLSPDEVRALVDSPAFHAGVLTKAGATVHPARLARGLRRVLLERGVRIHEGTHVSRFGAGDPAIAVTGGGTVRAGAAVLAVNAWAQHWRRFKRAITVRGSYIVLTAPSPDRLAAINWTTGLGVSDERSAIHYVRTTPDGRIAFGIGGMQPDLARHIDPRFGYDEASIRVAVDDMHRMFPSFADVPIEAGWGGPIDVSAA